MNNENESDHRSEEELINDYNSKQNTTSVDNKENIVCVEDYEQTPPQSPRDSVKANLSPSWNQPYLPFSGSPKVFF